MARLLSVMDAHLDGRDWFVGKAYSIADMAVYPWVEGAVNNPAMPARLNLKRWAERLASRSAVQKGMDVARDQVRPEIVEGGMKGFDDEHRSQLFGDAQHARND